MKSGTRIILWILAFVVIIFFGIAGMLKVQATRKAAQAAAEARQNEVAIPSVRVETVRTGSISKAIWITGDVQALKSVDVVPKVAGRLECFCGPDGKLVEEGTQAHVGDTVAQIDDDQFQAMLKSAEAALEAAKAANETAKVNLENADREKNRWAELRKGGAGTDQQLDQAITARKLAEAMVRQTDAQIVQAEAAVSQAQVNLKDTVIDAPFSGVVSYKYVDEGAFVGPTQPLFRLVDLSQVEITGGVAGRYYPEIVPGNTAAEVEVDAYPGKTYTGIVDRIRPELDRATRTAAVTIRVENKGLELKPGMYARMKIVIERHDDVTIVPDDALQSDGLKTTAYVVNDGTIVVRNVQVGLEEGAENEILNGLAPGEVVVVSAKDVLRDGTAVKTEEAAQ